MNLIKSTVLLSLTITTSAAMNGDIIVTGKKEILVSPESIETSSITRITDADSALMLDRIPGVTIGRKGGHGNEVIMRGLKDQGLNILIEDKYLHGGCPNRMDPVTSYIAPEFYDIVEIETGVVTLAEGRGGPGGSIRFVEKGPDFSRGPFSMLVGSGFESNSNTQNHYTQMTSGTETLAIKGKYSYKDAKNYQDGSGDSVLSSFNQQNAGVKFYWNPSKKTQMDLSYDYDLAKDVLYQGRIMNSPRSEAQSLQLRAQHQFSNSSFIKSLKAVAYQTSVDHLMANDPSSAMYMEIQVDSITQGAKLEALYSSENFNGRFGIDLQNLEQTPYRTISNGSFKPTRQPSFVNQWGLFGEHEWEAFAKTLLKLGARYDHVSAYSQELNFKPSMMFNTALSEYENVYNYQGDSEASQSEDNLSGLVRMNQRINKYLQHALSLSRTVRTADPYERYIYRPHMNGSMRQLGNPGLAPERHHQMDYSIIWNGPTSEIKFNSYYNRVADFITKDRARGQEGIGVSDQRLIYRNVDALLLGATLSARHEFNSALTVGGSLTYTYGENTTDHRALYEIPPVLLNAFTQYRWGERFTSLMEFVSQLKQTRIDSDSTLGAGVDAGASKAWATVNLSIEGLPLKSLMNWKVRAGVRNLLDKAYARHINRADALTSTQVRVNDPGRSLWLATEYRF